MHIRQIFLKEGNFSPWLRTLFMIIGICVVYVSLKYFDSILMMSLGLLFAALGGYSSRAHTLGLKPFDNSYKKAKQSYQSHSDKELEN